MVVNYADDDERNQEVEEFFDESMVVNYADDDERNQEVEEFFDAQLVQGSSPSPKQ